MSESKDKKIQRKEVYGIVNIINPPDNRQVKNVSLLILDFENDDDKNDFVKFLEEELE